MATGPVVVVHQAVTPKPKTVRRLASDGEKPASYYLAATRRAADRDYVPRYDLDD